MNRDMEVRWYRDVEEWRSRDAEGVEGVRALRNTETRGETDSLIC